MIKRDKVGKPVQLQLKVSSSLEAKLEWLIRMNGLPTPEKQYRFHPTRKWRMDFAWPDHGKIFVETDGEESHVRYHRASKDAEKRNAAVLLGWRPLTATGAMLRQNPMGFIDLLREVLLRKSAQEIADKALGSPEEL